jgi:23S rRNA (guanosine2251-2'-O)-methyltransferase
VIDAPIEGRRHRAGARRARAAARRGRRARRGPRPVEEAFAAGRPPRRLLVTPQRRQALERIVLHATTLRIPIVEVEGGSLTAVAGFDGHQGVAVVVEARRFASLDDVLARSIERSEAAFVLVLDSLEDPQNVGTLLRSAEAAGVHGVVFPTERQAPLTPAAIKASAGATEHLLLAPVEDPRRAPDRPPPARVAHRRLRCRGARSARREADLRGPTADRRRQRGARPEPRDPPPLRPVRPHPDAGLDRLAQRCRRRLDPALRGARPARSGGASGRD